MYSELYTNWYHFQFNCYLVNAVVKILHTKHGFVDDNKCRKYRATSIFFSHKYFVVSFLCIATLSLIWFDNHLIQLVRVITIIIILSFSFLYHFLLPKTWYDSCYSMHFNFFFYFHFYFIPSRNRLMYMEKPKPVTKIFMLKQVTACGSIGFQEIVLYIYVHSGPFVHIYHTAKWDYVVRPFLLLLTQTQSQIAIHCPTSTNIAWIWRSDRDITQ